MVVNEIGVDFRKAYSVPLTTENIIHRIYDCVIQKQVPEGSLRGYDWKRRDFKFSHFLIGLFMYVCTYINSSWSVISLGCDML